MAAKPVRHLRIVDEDSGEVLEKCPTCEEWARKYNGALSQIGKLRADKDAEARGHDLWPKAVELFDYWKRATGHSRSRWTEDRFWIIEKFLRREGYEECLYALEGLLGSAWHMKRGRYAKRDGQRFDEFERPFESQKDFERFRDMCPMLDFWRWFDALPGR